MEIVMIKAFTLEGIVSNFWRYAMALLFRLACYRDRVLLQKPLIKIRPAAYFVTSWVLKNHLGVLVEVEKNYHVCIHCFLHSRDCAVCLVDFVIDNRGPELTVPDNRDPSEVLAPSEITEAAVSDTMGQLIRSKQYSIGESNANQ
jgi:hypothetical protein